MMCYCAVAIEWWEGGNFYQIYPRSFMDSDGNGVGDLQGIKSKVSYLKELGMDAVWLSPIMKSPMADYGYDISDYRDIHYEFGNLKDFDELLAECKLQGIKLILDLVPNHTSDEHDCFGSIKELKDFVLMLYHICLKLKQMLKEITQMNCQ